VGRRSARSMIGEKRVDNSRCGGRSYTSAACAASAIAASAAAAAAMPPLLLLLMPDNSRPHLGTSDTIGHTSSSLASLCSLRCRRTDWTPIGSWQPRIAGECPTYFLNAARRDSDRTHCRTAKRVKSRAADIRTSALSVGPRGLPPASESDRPAVGLPARTDRSRRERTFAWRSSVCESRAARARRRRSRMLIVRRSNAVPLPQQHQQHQQQQRRRRRRRGVSRL
jgi:hypothetical protein